MTTLVELLASPQQSDLDQVRERIAELERELAVLRQAEKILDVGLNGKPSRAPRESKAGAKANGVSELAERIYDAIAQHGAMPAGRLAQILNVKAQAIGVTAARCNWFRRTAEGDWDIAKTK